MACTCPDRDVLDCECSLADSDCFLVSGSGNGVALSIAPNLDPDVNNIITCSASGLLAQLPAALRSPDRCQVTHNAAQSIPINGVPLAFNTENYDTASMHDTVTNNGRITIVTAGVYISTLNVAWAANATGDREIWIRKNGSDYLGKEARKAASASFETCQNVTVVEEFEVGDYIEAIAQQSSGGALNVVSAAYSPIFSTIYRRGATT